MTLTKEIPVDRPKERLDIILTQAGLPEFLIAYQFLQHPAHYEHVVELHSSSAHVSAFGWLWYDDQGLWFVLDVPQNGTGWANALASFRWRFDRLVGWQVSYDKESNTRRFIGRVL